MKLLKIKSTYFYIFKYNFIWIIGILLFFPFFTIFLHELNIIKRIPEHLEPNYQLHGDFTKSKLDPFIVFGDEFKKQYEQWFVENLPMKSYWIRLHNQLQYSLFNHSYGQEKVIVGEDNSLLTRFAIDLVCSKEKIDLTPGEKKDRLSHTNLEQWARSIKELQMKFESKGQKFIYLLSPSKTEIHPEAIPKRFNCSTLKLEFKEFFKEKLTSLNVRFLDSKDSVMDMKNQGDFVYPLGGLHWNMKTVTNITLILLEKLGINKINPTFAFSESLDQNPTGDDLDLTHLLNLFMPNKNYFSYKVDIIPNIRPLPFKILLVGDSYLTGIFDTLCKTNLFEKVDFLFYFNKKHFYNRSGTTDFLITNGETTEADIYKLVDEANIIILGENTQSINLKGNNDFYRFVMKRD